MPANRAPGVSARPIPRRIPFVRIAVPPEISTVMRRHMAITINDVGKIAHLARLAVNAEECQQYHTELSSILTLVEQLQQANTEGCTPLSHPLAMTQRLRPDEVTESDQHERFQAIAPSTEAGLYLVPKVIED